MRHQVGSTGGAGRGSRNSGGSENGAAAPERAASLRRIPDPWDAIGAAGRRGTATRRQAQAQDRGTDLPEQTVRIRVQA
jgi:hypothetical protein